MGTVVVSWLLVVGCVAPHIVASPGWRSHACRLLANAPCATPPCDSACTTDWLIPSHSACGLAANQVLHRDERTRVWISVHLGPSLALSPRSYTATTRCAGPPSARPRCQRLFSDPSRKSPPQVGGGPSPWRNLGQSRAEPRAISATPPQVGRLVMALAAADAARGPPAALRLVHVGLETGREWPRLREIAPD